MLKCVSINRVEGNGTIERIEGNGWDIDVDRIELNGINAHIIHDHENRFISLNGPAVKDLFKNLCDLLKENGELRHDIDEMEKENTGLRNYIDEMKKSDESANCCANDVLITETLYLRQTIEKLEKDLKEKETAIRVLASYKERHVNCCQTLEKTIEEKDSRIKTLEKELCDANIEIAKLNDKLERYDSAQTISSRRNTNLIKKCDSLEKDLKETEAIIEGKNARIKNLNREVKDKDIEIERLNNSLSNYYELYEKCHVLENKLTVKDKLDPILDFISDAAYDTVNFATKTFLYFIPDYDVTVSVSRKEENDIEIDKSEKYDVAKEILGWLKETMENNTDYATKIFNKKSKENIFSITFCKVPVEPEVVTNEQD